MGEIISLSCWVEIIHPCYFNNKRNRRPVGIEIILLMYLIQVWFNLSNKRIEDSIYETAIQWHIYIHRFQLTVTP